MSLFFKKLTFVKIFNLFHVFFEYFLFTVVGRNKRNSFPYSISIEPTNNCNLRCPQCPTGLGVLNRSKGYMSLDLFKIVIDKSHKYLLNLFIYFQGEPFLNKNIFEMIEYANSKNVYTTISSNAMFVDEIIAQRVVLSGLDKIIISYDGINNETYQKYRIGGNLLIVQQAISFLKNKKIELNKNNPQIELQFIVNRFNEHQIKEFIEFAKSLKLNYKLKTMQIVDFETINTFLPIFEKYSRYKYFENQWKLKRKLKNRCFRIWNSLVIGWNGDVLPCCYDKDATYKLGNINNDEFYKIKGNEKFRQFAQKTRKNIEQIEICRNCDL